LIALAMVDLLLPLARAASPRVYTGIPHRPGDRYCAPPGGNGPANGSTGLSRRATTGGDAPLASRNRSGQVTKSPVGKDIIIGELAGKGGMLGGRYGSVPINVAVRAAPCSLFPSCSAAAVFRRILSYDLPAHADVLRVE
jgi:hypothetical protein